MARVDEMDSEKAVGPQRETWSVREARRSDWEAIWPIFEVITRAQDTFVYAPDMTSAAARELWMSPVPARTVVVEDTEGRIVGTARMGPNYPGPGAHMATASFMVSPQSRGKGVGSAMGRHVLSWAASQGYLGMQFNAVVESNNAAVRLWKRLGFTIIGTSPGAFRHPDLGLVGLHTMHFDLSQARPGMPGGDTRRAVASRVSPALRSELDRA